MIHKCDIWFKFSFRITTTDITINNYDIIEMSWWATILRNDWTFDKMVDYQVLNYFRILSLKIFIKL